MMLSDLGDEDRRPNPETELRTKLQTSLEFADIDEDQGDARITDGDAHMQFVHKLQGSLS